MRFRELNDAMVNEFRDLSGNISDILHVGISQTRSQIIMPDLIRRMRKELPHVQIRISERTNDVLIEKLLEGELDIMIGNVSDHHPKIFKETLYSESMVLILPTGFLTREQLTKMNRTGDLSVLEEVPFVMNTQNDTAGRFGTAILESSHIVPYTAAMSDSAETCLRMCIDGLGAYICPDIYVRFYRDRLKHLSIIPLDYSYQICLARRQELYDKTSIQTFWKCCREMKYMTIYPTKFHF